MRNITTVEKYGWCAVYPNPLRPLLVKTDALVHSLAANVSIEPIQIQANTRCILLKDWPRVGSLMPHLLIVIEQVVHFPELSLKSGGFSRTCRCELMRLNRYPTILTKH